MKSRKCFRELQHRRHFLYVGAKHDLIQWKLLLQRKLILIKNTHEKKHMFLIMRHEIGLHGCRAGARLHHQNIHFVSFLDCQFD